MKILLKQDFVYYLLQGAAKNGTTPDGISYVDAADKEEIKVLLQ